MNGVKKILERMKQVLNAKSYTEIANKLGVTRNTVDVWVQRGKIPEKNIVKFCQLTNCNQSWLLTGQGSMFSDNSSHNTPPKLDKEFEVICEYLKDLDRSKRKKVLKYILELSDNGE